MSTGSKLPSVLGDRYYRIPSLSGTTYVQVIYVVVPLRATHNQSYYGIFRVVGSGSMAREIKYQSDLDLHSPLTRALLNVP